MRKAVVGIGYFCENTQAAINAGLNGFGALLLAESYGDEREKFPAGGVLFAQHDHKGRTVYITVSAEPPDIVDCEETQGGKTT